MLSAQSLSRDLPYLNLYGTGIPPSSQKTRRTMIHSLSIPTPQIFRSMGAFIVLFAMMIAPTQASGIFPFPNGGKADMSIELRDKVTTRKADAGDYFDARLAADLVHRGQIIAKAGTPVRGEVIFTQSGQRKYQKRRAEMTLVLTDMKVNGVWVPLETKELTLKGRHKTGAVKVAGGVALGTWLGGIKGAAKGGLLGLGYAALTPDKHIVLRKGTQLDFRVKKVSQLRREAKRTYDD